MATSYDDVLTQNVRAARSRKRLGQATVVTRMRALGYTAWHRQTVGKIERGERRVLAGELLGLALALETSIGALLEPSIDDRIVTLPAGQELQGGSVSGLVRFVNDGRVSWEDGSPRFGDPVWTGTQETTR